MLTRTEILRIVPVFPKEEVDTPEWNGTSIWIRVMTSAERDKLEAEMAKTNQTNFRARLVLYTACNEDGTALFQPHDLPWLGNQSALLMARLADVAMRLNGYSKAEIEDLEKNSESGQTNGSATDWPRSSVAPSVS